MMKRTCICGFFVTGMMALDDVDGFEEERKYLLDEIRTICEKIRKDSSKEYLGQLP